MLLEVIARNTSALTGASGSGQGSSHQSRGGLSEFLRTQPPTFSRSEDPLDADDWLVLIERKLSVAQCQEHEKALFASHQLEGAALAWWGSFLAMQPAGHTVTWEEFRTAFRRSHVPTGLMKVKKREFLSLKQGRFSVSEYLYEFNHLSRYAPEDVATDEAKQERFTEGLSEELQDKLAAVDFPDFQALVDKAIIVEHKGRALVDSRKRKWEAHKSSKTSFSRPRFQQSQGSQASAPPRSSAPTPRPS
ncbi:retrotransposon gag domain-containing protein [Salmonella enterica subsp. enterica serovar Goldcoast]|nr:retrotransposon gag domain-containing protein [Salmonella enterica subsp. enterica serovar Goldcoast]